MIALLDGIGHAHALRQTCRVDVVPVSLACSQVIHYSGRYLPICRSHSIRINASPLFAFIGITSWFAPAS